MDRYDLKITVTVDFEDTIHERRNADKAMRKLLEPLEQIANALGIPSTLSWFLRYSEPHLPKEKKLAYRFVIDTRVQQIQSLFHLTKVFEGVSAILRYSPHIQTLDFQAAYSDVSSNQQ